MTEHVRSPGPVNEETIPVSSNTSGAAVDATVDYSTNRDRTAERMSTLSNRKPESVSEPTEPVPNEPSSTNENILDTKKRNQWPRLFWAFALFIVCWLFYATLVSLQEAWNNSFYLAIPLTIITAAFIIILGFYVWREWRAFQSIDRIQETQQQLRQYIDEDSIIGVHETLKPTFARIKINYPEEYRQFDEARHARQNVKEYLSLLENVVLSKLDKDIDDSINQAMLTVAGLVALSPYPALDAVIVMIRANMLLRKISHIYGLELTGLSSMYLFKHTIISAITAAGIEELGSIVMEEFAVGVTENALKIATEGTVSYARMYRLGKFAKNIIRPVPSII